MQAFDLRGKRGNAGVTVPEISQALGLQPQVVRAVETGKLGIDEATYALFLATISRVAYDKRSRVEAVA